MLVSLGTTAHALGRPDLGHPCSAAVFVLEGRPWLSSAIHQGPALLQLCPLGSWGRARPMPDDLTGWKREILSIPFAGDICQLQSREEQLAGVPLSRQMHLQP